jgi:phenylalanyl-tRNA synthetase beta subunit
VVVVVADPVFFPGRCAEVMLINRADGTAQRIGGFGVIHPEVGQGADISITGRGWRGQMS